MKKLLLIFLVASFIYIPCQAQPQAYNTTIEYQKAQVPGAAIELPYSTDVVENAIKDFMEKKGSKGSGMKGFTVYRGITMDPSDSGPSDLHFKVERKKKERDIAVIYLLTAKPSQDPISSNNSADSSAGTGTVEKSKSFLNSLVPVVEAENLREQISSQQDILKKAQKKLNDLQDDYGSMDKKLRKAQSDLDDNKNDQLKKTHDIQDNIKSNDEALKKAQKKLNNLIDDQADLEKKIRKLQSEMEENKKNQDAQSQVVDKQKSILEALQAKQKN